MRYRFGRCELDGDGVQLWRDGSRVSAQPRVLSVLVHLIRNRERVVSKDELLRELWGGASVEESALSRAVYLARKAVGDDARSQGSIRTVSRIGFQFVAPVQELDPGATTPTSPATTRPGDAFIGREALLAQLHDALERAIHGEGSVVFLSGEAGIGKTRGAEEFAREAAARGVLVATARCVEGEGTPPHWPWIQIVRSIVAATEPGRLRETLGEGAPWLAALLPSLRQALPDLPEPAQLDGPTARFQLFEALCGMLRAVSAERPVLVSIDDLHWADRSSLRALQHCVPEARSQRLLLLGTYRPHDLRNEHGLLDVLDAASRNPAHQDLTVPPLSRSEVAAMVHTLTGGDAPNELSDTVWQRSSGNPLFARQILLLLRERGELGEGAGPGDGLGRAAVPPALEGVIRSRLRGVSAMCRDTLACASVLGVDFDLELLDAIREDARAELLDALQEAMTRGLLHEETGNRYRFAHPLLQEVLRDGQPASRLAELQGRIAEAMEKRHADDPRSVAAEVALRALAAARGGGSAERAVRWSLRAAEAAAAQFAWDEAVGHAEHALEAFGLLPAPDPVLHVSLLCRLGEARNGAGEIALARETLAQAAAVATREGDLLGLARAALGLGHQLLPFETGVRDELQARILRDAIERVPARDAALRSRLLGRLALVESWSEDEDGCVALAHEAVELARKAEEPDALAYALGASYVTGERLSSFASRIDVADELVAASDRSGDPTLAIWARHLRVVEAMKNGRLAAAVVDVEAIEQRADSLRLPVARSRAAALRAMLAFMAGRLGEGERLALRALELGRTGDPTNALQAFGAQLFYLRFEQGRLGELEGQVRGLVAQYPDLGAWRAALALLLSETGQLDASRAELAPLLVEGLARLDGAITGGVSLMMAAQACVRVGDAAGAAVLVPWLERLAPFHAMGPVGYCGPFSLVAGALAALVGRFDEAERSFAAAIEAAEGLGSVPYALRARFERARARALRGARGDAARARSEAAEVGSQSEPLGLTGLTARALALASGAPDA